MGPLQRTVYWRLCLVFFFTAFLFFIDVFTGMTGSCTEHNWNGTGAGNDTHASHRLNHFDLDEQKNILGVNSSSCVEREVEPYGQTSYMTGLLLGSLFGGVLSDRWGKRVVLLGCALVHALLSLLLAFLPHPAFHLPARGLTGIACYGIQFNAFSLGVEWSLPRYRMWPPALLSFSFSLGMMGLAGVAYFTHTWMQLHLALAIPQLLCLPLYVAIPESPRWLLLNCRAEVLEDYRKRSPEDRDCLEQLLELQDAGCSRSVTEADIEPLKQADGSLLTSPTVLLRLCIMSFISLATALTYFGICFNVGKFGVDVYLAQFFSGLSETPSLLMPLLLARCGRRPFSMASLLLSGTACLLSLLVSQFCDIPALVMALALMGKLCVQTTMCVCVLYAIELFPTIIRQRCVGLVNLFYRVGCILNAVMTPHGGIPLAAMICYASGPILGAGLCMLLPETSGIPLPDSILDCEKQPRPPLRLCPMPCPCKRRQSIGHQPPKDQVANQQENNGTLSD